MCKPQAISITTSEMALVARRKTSLTIRHRLCQRSRVRLPPAHWRRSGCRTSHPPLAFCLGAFFGWRGQPPVRLVALATRIFVQRGVGAVSNLGGIRRLFVVRFAWQRRPQIHDCACLFVDQENVRVSRRLFLAAVVCLLVRGVSRALVVVFGAIDRQAGPASQARKVLSRHAARRAPGPVLYRARCAAGRAGGDAIQ